MMRLLLGLCAEPLGTCSWEGGNGWLTPLQAATPNPIPGFSAVPSLVWRAGWGDLCPVFFLHR